MKFLYLIFLISFSSGQRSIKKRMIGPISRGFPTEISTVPYQAQLVRKTDGELFCGATIIDSCWLLTAAHCLLDDLKTFNVKTGSTITGEANSRIIEKTIQHPGYNNITLAHDIGLIKLKTCLRFGKTQKAVELSKNNPSFPDVVKISGYGQLETHDTDPSMHLREAYVPVVNKTECRSRYDNLRGRTVDESVFCAGRGYSDSCIGDSGGPAVLRGQLAGIISAGEECSDPFYPSLYTRIDVHLDWIKNVTKIR